MTMNEVPAESSEAYPPARRGWKELGMEAVLLLPNVVKLLVRITRDPRVPMRRKVVLAAVMAYVVSPIDLIPDFFIGVGRLDDVIVVAIALNHVMQGAGREVVIEHWDGSEDSLDLILSALEWGAEIVPEPLRQFLPS
jgi:uncharacterized membrane protein YkvA (DUF1232 family)